MAGIIGQAIANIGNTFGNYMLQSARDDEREQERKEREQARRLEREEDRRWREEQAALYRRPVDQQPAARTGGGDGGLSAKDIGEGGLDEGMLARRAGMTVPELRAMRRFSETGDTEPFKQDVKRYSRDEGALAGEGGKFSDAISRKYAALEETVISELPPGFEREARAKLQTLAKIEESYRLGGKYDDVTKGRRNQQEVDMSEAAIRQPGAAGLIGQGMAAGAGKDLVGGDSNVTRNKFTGETSTTEVGKSVITENQAQAKKYGADADRARREPTGKNDDLPTLQQMRLAADKKLDDARRALTEFDKVNTGDLSRPGREKLKEQRDALMLEVTNARGELNKVSERLTRRLDETEAASKPAAAPKPAPAPAASGSRKVGDTETIQAGPNKGKKARWDGTGWVLVN